MAYVYRHFIPQNTAPSGAKKIGVYDGKGNKVCTIPLGGLTPPTKETLYSFGLVSDVHIGATNISAYGYSWTKLDNTLSYFKSIGCAFCVITGDLTVTGFYTQAGEDHLDVTQFAKYKEICDKYDIPIYELMGNHESYYGMPISNNLALMETYTGKGVLSYTIEQGNDLFILLGQPHGSVVMTDADFTLLSETLAANTDKRCFVFIHPYIEEDSGDPLDVRENSIFDDKYWGAANRNAFINLLNQYPNVVLFHGHSHMKFEHQKVDIAANYTEKNGFKSVHIPSLATPRDIKYTYVKTDTNGEVIETNETLVQDTSGALGTLEKMESKDDPAASQGYIVDVYADCIVLNGWDFVNNQYVPLGVYKIAT
jgi:3',5'-cyclic AMP phosphodiesterase CpdA